MDSIGWFLVILAFIAGIILVVIVGGFVFVALANGGCLVIIGLGLLWGAIALLNVGGLAGGFGILLLLLGAGAPFMGVSMLKDTDDW